MVLGTLYNEELYPHRKIVAIPLFNSLIPHFDKLIKTAVHGYSKAKKHDNCPYPQHIDIRLDNGLQDHIILLVLIYLEHKFILLWQNVL